MESASSNNLKIEIMSQKAEENSSVPLTGREKMSSEISSKSIANHRDIPDKSNFTQLINVLWLQKLAFINKNTMDFVWRLMR
jgi:hypothetical protein